MHITESPATSIPAAAIIGPKNRVGDPIRKNSAQEEE